MPLDAICLAAVKDELSGLLTGFKIDKVQQPERDTVILTLRGGDRPQCKLLISAGSGDMRVHMTGYRYENPASPPMFCMLLRKHLTGARFTGVYQPPSERVIVFLLRAPDPMGVISEKRLVVELLGRLSNIILTDDEGIIIDCLKRFGGESADKRAVLPGLFYRFPPPQTGKQDPLSVTEEKWQKLFDDMQPGNATADNWLLSQFSALSPLICRELSWRAYGEACFHTGSITDGGAALRSEFFAFIESCREGRYEPWLIAGPDNAGRDFSYTRIMQYESAFDVRRESSFSDMLDRHYTQAAQLQRIKQRSATVIKTIKTARERMVRKLTAQRAELEKTADRSELRECGDLITANLHLMRKGQSTLMAQDFFSEQEETRTIALDPLKTPQQNAARYYKEYAKAGNAQKYLTEQILRGENELAYLDSVLGETALIENARDLDEIRGELIQTGYIREKKQGKERVTESAPLEFTSSAGLPILAGRNNTQNDRLTFKTAKRTDVWLHAQKIHGAHVVISCSDAKPDEESLREAATIAAYYSASRNGGKTPVDYTLVRNVKKPAGSRPGMVVYTDYKTVIATPDKEKISKLKTGN